MNGYDIARLAERRVLTQINELRQAERDVEQHCGMAFDGDTAEDIYAAALEHRFGVSRSKTQGLSAEHLQKILKLMHRQGASGMPRSMAYDSREPSKLDAIFGGAPTPVDLTNRNDIH